MTKLRKNTEKHFLTLILLTAAAWQNVDAQLIEFGPIIKDSTSAYVKDSVPKWAKKTEIHVNMAQSSYTNWANGGENSLSVNGRVYSYWNYSKQFVRWDNSLDLAYGMQYQDSEFAKTEDKIDFSSKYGRLITKQMYGAGFFSFKTQFTTGYSDGERISNCLSPGYTITAVGIDYRPDKNFTAFLSPITDKITMVLDDKVDPSTYGTLDGHRMRNELGAYLRTKLNRAFFQNTVDLSTKVELFSDYLHNPQNVDVNWECLVKLKVNKYISSTISTQLMYDDDTKTIRVDENGDSVERGARVQFKEIIGVGIVYIL